jgi:hypothetical protein
MPTTDDLRTMPWIAFAWLLWLGGCTSDGRFVAVGDTVVRDARTGLEWTRRDDGGGGLEWHAADAYCRSLPVDAGRSWRLPAIEELRGLYGGPASTPCGDETCAIDPAFTLKSPYVWTASAPFGPNARTYLDFRFGTELTPSLSPRLLRSVLCVR